MGLLGGSDIEESVDASVDEVKERSDEVDVDDMRSPKELIDQVDRLEEVVAGIRKRQDEIAKNHSEDLHNLELDERIDFSELKNDVQKSDSSADFSDVEERIESLEVAVDRLEAGFEMSADELRENITEEALDVENRRLREINQKISQLEREIEASEVEEKVDRSELQQKLEEFRDDTEKISGIESRLRNLEIGEDVIEEEVESEAENLRELLMEELSSVYEHRIEEIEDRLETIQEDIGLEKIENLIDREELEKEIDDARERNESARSELLQRVEDLESRISDSSIEEKVDSERLEDEIQSLRDDLEWELGEKEHELRQEIESLKGENRDIDEIKSRLANLEIGEDIIKEEMESETSNLRELLMEELTAAYEHRIDEVERRIRHVEDESRADEALSRIDELEGRILNSSMEEKVDASRMEQEIESLREDLEEEIGEQGAELQKEIEEKVGTTDLEERLVVLEQEVEALVQETPEMEERTEELENRIEELAEKDEEVTQDIDDRLNDLEEAKESDGDISREEFEELKDEVEEMSELLVKVARDSS